MADVWSALDGCVSFVDRLADPIPASGIERFLFDAVWQSTLIGLVTCGMLLAVRQRASQRAALAWLGIMLAVIVPLGTAAVRAANWGQRSAAVSAANEESLPPLAAASDPEELLAAMEWSLPAIRDDLARSADDAATISEVPSDVALIEIPPLDSVPPEQIVGSPTQAISLPIGRMLLVV